MVQYCVAYNCKTRAGEGYAFFKFPEDPLLRNKWCLALKRKNFIPSKYSKICSKHFLKDDIDENRTGFPYLKKGAVPSIFDFSAPDSNNYRLRKRKMEVSSSRPSVISSVLDKENSNEVHTGILKNKKSKTFCERRNIHVSFADCFIDNSAYRDGEVNDISTVELKVKQEQDWFSDNFTEWSGDLSDNLTAGIEAKRKSGQEQDRVTNNSNRNDDVIVNDISTEEIKEKQDEFDSSKTTNFPLIIRIKSPSL